MPEKASVTPWSVSGDLTETQYQRIAQDFGAKLIDSQMIERVRSVLGGLHPYLINGTFYAHRDMDVALDDFQSGRRVYLYTGRGPSGRMHLGHILPFLFTKWLQERMNAHLIIQITDDEKFVFRDIDMKDVARYTRENVLDILSLGFDPKKTHILIDTENAGLLYNSAIKIARFVNVTLSKAVFGFQESDNVGKYFFTCIQSVPAFILSEITGETWRCLIPYAIDQDPHFKVSRDVLPRIGMPKPSSIISKFMPALKGSGKMSSSDPNSGIFLDDTPSTVRKKLMKYAFSGGRDTAEEQRKYGANPDVDFAFNAYRLLEPDIDKVKKVYDSYRSGAILSGEMKSIAADTINLFLAKLRELRPKAEELYDDFKFRPEKFM
ncbi:tryptophan--tRNA ligase [Thermoplasmatales archaeon AK]|nr:tryptophan--tRNA ligase [Thermoplasmatales archaeon AK]